MFPFRSSTARPALLAACLVVVAACEVSGGRDGAPSLARLEDRSTPRTEPLDVPIEVTDESASTVDVTAVSSDPSIVPANGLSVLGSGASRTLRILPEPLASGSTQISVTARDAGGASVSEAFTLTTTVPFLADRWKVRGSESDVNGRFGGAVAVEGTTAVVGAPNEAGSNGLSGAVYVFELEGGAWSESQRITSPDAGPGDGFGRSVAIDGGILVVGASGHEHASIGSNRGAAYVYVRNGTSWAYEAELRAPDADDDDRFGSAVGVSGDAVVVTALFREPDGSSLYDAGAAYVFRRSGTAWLPEQTLVASTPLSEESFGQSVAIDGDDVLVGAVRGTGAVSLSGVAYAYRHDGSSWQAAGKLFAPAAEAASNDVFGSDVALDGGTAVVGAYGASPGGVFAMGAAYVFERSGSVWGPPTRLTATGGVSLDELGSSVDVQGDYVLVGTPGRDDGAPDAGVAVLFHRHGSGWTEQAVLRPSEPAEDDRLGRAVALGDDVAFVGNEDDDDDGFASGSVYAFRK